MDMSVDNDSLRTSMILLRPHDTEMLEKTFGDDQVIESNFIDE